MATDPNNEDILEHDTEAERLLDAAPWDTANTDPTLPEIAFTFEVLDATGQLTQKSNKLMLRLVLEVVAPTEYAERRHYENFVIGTDKDPAASKSTTWDAGTSPASTNLWRLLKTTGCRTWRDLKGKRFSAQARVSENEETGVKYTNLISYVKEGDINPGVPTPPRAPHKQKRSSFGGAAGFVAPAPDAPVSCSTCGSEVLQGDLMAHMAVCVKPNSEVPF